MTILPIPGLSTKAVRTPLTFTTWMLHKKPFLKGDS